MHDAHAAGIALQCRDQELAQQHFRLGRAQAMQIQFGLDEKLSASQFAQRRCGDAGPGEEGRIGRGQLRFIVRAVQNLLEHEHPVGTGEAGAGARFGWFSGHPGRLRQRFHPAEGLAKQTLLVIVTLGLHRISRRGASTAILARVSPGPGEQDSVKILVSNDDGYRADGILVLADALKDLGQVTVVAPDRNRSGASNSLTLDVPLRVQQIEPDVFCVLGGTPTDCVHLAISGLFNYRHDMVVSGVNDGANLGDDVLYSGTVAAAMEGRYLGLPSLAVSLCTSETTGRHFATAARVARLLVGQLLEQPLERAMILNVNIPDLPFEQLRGWRTTRLGMRHPAEPVVEARDQRNRVVYWIGPAGAGAGAGEGTDFHAVSEGFVSVTPLQVDLTRYSALDTVQEWLAKAGWPG
jgi:5'-nucleotidase